tara:strand:+ start:11414 stop:14080 length:2667 start_codon:yes stop_codon:yes gene_type:complete
MAEPIVGFTPDPPTSDPLQPSTILGGLVAGRYGATTSGLSPEQYHALLQQYIRAKADIEVQHQQVIQRGITTYSGVVSSVLSAQASLISAQAQMAGAQASANRAAVQYASMTDKKLAEALTDLSMAAGDDAILNEYAKRIESVRNASITQFETDFVEFLEEDTNKDILDAGAKSGATQAQKDAAHSLLLNMSAQASETFVNQMSSYSASMIGEAKKNEKQYYTALDMEDMSRSALAGIISNTIRTQLPAFSAYSGPISDELVRRTISPVLTKPHQPWLNTYERRQNAAADALDALRSHEEKFRSIGVSVPGSETIGNTISSLSTLVNQGPSAFMSKLGNLPVSDSFDKASAEIDVAIASLSPDDPLEARRLDIMSTPGMRQVALSLGLHNQPERWDNFYIRNAPLIYEMIAEIHKDPSLGQGTSESMSRFKERIGAIAREEHHRPDNPVAWPERALRIDSPPDYLMQASREGIAHSMPQLDDEIKKDNARAGTLDHDTGKKTKNSIPRGIRRGFAMDAKFYEEIPDVEPVVPTLDEDNEIIPASVIEDVPEQIDVKTSRDWGWQREPGLTDPPVFTGEDEEDGLEIEGAGVRPEWQGHEDYKGQIRFDPSRKNKVLLFFDKDSTNKYVYAIDGTDIYIVKSTDPKHGDITEDPKTWIKATGSARRAILGQMTKANGWPDETVPDWVVQGAAEEAAPTNKTGYTEEEQEKAGDWLERRQSAVVPTIPGLPAAAAAPAGAPPPTDTGVGTEVPATAEPSPTPSAKVLPANEGLAARVSSPSGGPMVGGKSDLEETPVYKAVSSVSKAVRTGLSKGAQELKSSSDKVRAERLKEEREADLAELSRLQNLDPVKYRRTIALIKQKHPDLAPSEEGTPPVKPTSSYREGVGNQ